MVRRRLTRNEAYLLSLIRRSPDEDEAVFAAIEAVLEYNEGVGTVKPLTLTVPTDTNVSDKYRFLFSRFCKME